MTRSTLIFSTFAMTCVVALAAPAAANDWSGAHAQRAGHRHAIPASAEALSPSRLAPAYHRDDDSDGLTRNTAECNRGCIDN